MPISWEDAADAGYIEILLSDSHGIYVPQTFCEYYDGVAGWEGIDEEDKNACLGGPEGPAGEWYWEAWDAILNNARFVDPVTGDVWYLYQDGDLFAIRADIELED